MPLWSKVKYKKKNSIYQPSINKNHTNDYADYQPYYAEINQAYYKNNKPVRNICSKYLRAACARQLIFGKFTRTDIWNDLKIIEGKKISKPHWIITKNPQWFVKCLLDSSYKLNDELIP